MKKINEKIKCDKCNKIMRGKFMAFYGEKKLCFRCKPNKIGLSLTIEDAKKRFYKVHFYKSKKGRNRCVIYVPECLAKKYVRIEDLKEAEGK